MTPEEFAEVLAREEDFCEVVHAAVRRWYTAVTPEYARLAMFANLSMSNFARDIVCKRVRNVGGGVAFCPRVVYTPDSVDGICVGAGKRVLTQRERCVESPVFMLVRAP